MTEREKVIDYLEYHIHLLYDVIPHVSRDDGEYLEAAAKTMSDAFALLKAQEPVEPIIEKNISTGECEDPWGRLFFCGACGKRINEKYNPDEDDKYCKHCGRAVKWE